MSTTRIAPSPTGYFHLGTARTAYFNYLVAKATGGRFILRIDDTDLARNETQYYDTIFEGLEWLGLTPDEVHYQSQRLELYRNAALTLLKQERAVLLEGGAIALKGVLPVDSWRDTISGDIPIREDDCKSIENLVIMKSDGMPTYNFCSILDDMDMGIDWVIRGVDHLKNTPKQLAVLYTMGIIVSPDGAPSFTHIGLIHENKVKMSKRRGAVGLLEYKAQGYDPRAILNHILKLGWSHPDSKFDSKYKTISMEQAIALVMEGRFRAAPSNHSKDKLDNLNKLWKQKD